MATWTQPPANALSASTYIKDTDDKLQATMDDLEDFVNSAGSYVGTGLQDEYVKLTTAQTVTGVKTIDTGGAIDFTNGELRIGSTAVTSTATELNLLDGVTASTAEINLLDGVTSSTAELNILDGVTASATDLNKTSNLTSGTYTPTSTGTLNMSAVYGRISNYQRNGDIVTVITTSSGATNVRVSLPIASNLANTYSDLAGSGMASSFYEPVRAIADTTNNAATINFNSPYGGTTTISAMFMYEIL